MRIKKLLAPVLAFIIIISAISPAYAVSGFGDFTDVSGHWAEATMKRGFEDGLIEGYGDGTIRPDAAITTAQMISVLTRLLSASKKSEISGADGAWYEDALAEAVYLGIVSPDCSPDAPMTRQDALSMMAKAFSLTPADPELTSLDRFSDSDTVSDENRPAMAALVSSGLVIGDGSALDANGSITRAQFLTILYRVAQNYVPASALTSSLDGGSVASGSAALFNLELSGNLWFDCSADDISLYAVKADTVTVRSHSLKKLLVYGGSEIKRLVIDCGEYSIGEGVFSDAKINTLQLAGTGSADISGGAAENIEITGDGVTAIVGGSHESLLVSGSGNSITLSPDAEIGSIRVLGSDCAVTTTSGCSAVCGKLEVSGSGNRLELCLAESCDAAVSGGSNTILLTLAGGDMEISGDGNSVTAGGEANAVVITGRGSLLTVDGLVDSVDISGRETTVDGSGSAQSIVINAQDCTVSLETESLTDNSAELEKQRVLGLVTTGYNGNYTLSWAKSHDYDDSDKEAWVDIKGYGSSTGYLIWVSLAMQRVNIFKGETGSWELIHSCIVGTGAPGRGTPVGVYTTTYKYKTGWTTSTYTVRPVVGFKKGTGYAFHSRLFYPGTSTLKDASIGYPVSHGCVRMYDDDIWYIYDNIPLGTTVVVY